MSITHTGLDPNTTPSPGLSPSQTVTATARPTQTPSATPTSTDTQTPQPTQTPTETITSTYAVLRGKVLQQANCRYGPGAPYLYKYGVYPGTVLEIIGRTEAGAWVVVQAIGGSNPCWVKADLLEIRGDVMGVAPMYLELPRSPYYGAMTNVSASRAGDEVTVSWGGIQLRPGDDSEQTPYVIEAWMCQNSELVFTPIGSYGFSAKIIDEAGCEQPSHGRITAAEKHGYTAWVEIPWPARDLEP
jgi:LysM repeat protein